jgi:hypothetical protein
VAPRASGTPALAEARAKLAEAQDALVAARDSLVRAADATPGARNGLLALRDQLDRIWPDFAHHVVGPFDRAVLDELLHRPPARKEG